MVAFSSFSVFDIYRAEHKLKFNSIVVAIFFLAAILKTESLLLENPRICGEYLTLGLWEWLRLRQRTFVQCNNSRLFLDLLFIRRPGFRFCV